MRQLFYDFETYFTTEYSLRKMTPPEYILGQEFEALGSSFAFDDEEPFWVDGPHLPAFLSAIDWDNVDAVCHNGLFDHMILAWRYGIHPKRYGDSMAMARSWVVHKTGSVALHALAQWFGLPAKWGTLEKTKGKRYADIVADPALHAEVRGYGCDDLIKCRTIYRTIMAEGYPEEQLDAVDLVVRMAADPRFVLDPETLYLYLGKVLAEKQELLTRVNLISRDALMSDDMFAELLYDAGIEPPTKTSPTTGQEIWAFAKSDKAFTDLEEDEDPRVQALVAARLGHKTTIEETRTRRLIAVANQHWINGTPACSLPVPLKISGAHTHRFSGDWLINLQNLKRGGELRKAIRARKGEQVVSVDASQIEARILAELAQELWLIAAFADNRDVYAEFGTTVFGMPVTKADYPDERFIGKTAVLQLGYGAGWKSFQGQVRTNSRNSGKQIDIGDAEAMKVVKIYRHQNKNIVSYWRYWDSLIPIMADPAMEPFMVGPVEVRYQEIVLPSGLSLRYHDLRQDDTFGEKRWIYNYGPRIKILYGAKVVENIVQALAFYHILQTALAVTQETNGLIRMAHQVHDELLFGIPEHIADDLVAYVRQKIATPPWWLPGVPLAAEGGAGDNYLDAK